MASLCQCRSPLSRSALIPGDRPNIKCQLVVPLATDGLQLFMRILIEMPPDFEHIRIHLVLRSHCPDASDPDVKTDSAAEIRSTLVSLIDEL